MAKDKVLFQNSQWKVTDYGLECRTTSYDIPKRHLAWLTTWDRERVYDAIVHVSDKTWVNVPLFLEAWHMALRLGLGPKKVNHTILRRSYGKAMYQWIRHRNWIKLLDKDTGKPKVVYYLTELGEEYDLNEEPF